MSRRFGRLLFQVTSIHFLGWVASRQQPRVRNQGISRPLHFMSSTFLHRTDLSHCRACLRRACSLGYCPQSKSRNLTTANGPLSKPNTARRPLPKPSKPTHLWPWRIDTVASNELQVLGWTCPEPPHPNYFREAAILCLNSLPGLLSSLAGDRSTKRTTIKSGAKKGKPRDTMQKNWLLAQFFINHQEDPINSKGFLSTTAPEAFVASTAHSQRSTKRTRTRLGMLSQCPSDVPGNVVNKPSSLSIALWMDLTGYLVVWFEWFNQYNWTEWTDYLI